VEPELNRVSRDGTTVRLEPRVMDVLKYLVERAGAVVPRHELVQAVWSTEFVAANTLTHAIFEIRRALGDDPRDPIYVETIPKRGYRVIARITGSVDWRRETGRCRYWAVVDGRSIPLSPGEHVIGRVADANIRIDVPGVSRRHARLRVSGEAVFVEDLGSKNGTYVDGRRVEGATAVRDGSIVRIGRRGSWLRVCGRDEDTLTDGDAGSDGSTRTSGGERCAGDSRPAASGTRFHGGRFTHL
jgi:DNA-binding winged helix-turn-helix (wHTH) protein